jgi:hypothetical protein
MTGPTSASSAVDSTPMCGVTIPTRQADPGTTPADMVTGTALPDDEELLAA